MGVVTMLYLHGLPAGVPRVVNGEPGEGGRWARCDTCGIQKTERHGRMCVTEAKLRPGWGWWTGKGE